MKLDLTLDDSGHQRFHSIYHDVQRRLRRTTKFSYLTIQGILVVYYKFVLANGKNAKYMRKQQFADFFQIFINMPNFELVDEVAQYVDPRMKGCISPEGFVKFLDVIVNGTLKEKIKFCFGVYEPTGLGFITRPRLKVLCRNMIYSEKAEDADEIVTEYIDLLMRKMDVDGDGKISFQDYSQTVEESPCLLQFLGKIFPDNIIPTERTQTRLF